MLFEKIQLEPGENIITQKRRHWFVLFAQLFSLFLGAILPLIFYLYGQSFFADFISNNDGLTSVLPIALFVYILWLMFLWIGTFNIWTNYYLDILTITNRRIILINQKGFFRRNVASFRLERLQDMNVEINGIIATLLDYGTIHAETAGHGDEEFRANGMPNPRELKSVILRAADNLIVSTPNHTENL